MQTVQFSYRLCSFHVDCTISIWTVLFTYRLCDFHLDYMVFIWTVQNSNGVKLLRNKLKSPTKLRIVSSGFFILHRINYQLYFTAS